VLANRRFLTCCATVLAIALGASSAIAKAPATHTGRISGVVLSINAKRHILTLRVKHAAKARRTVLARAAMVGGSSTILVTFEHATVNGPNGAVAVGDDVTVTTTGSSGSADVASSIAVIGQPNGGDAGKGAAIPGTVTAVDSAGGTLTLAVRSTDGQGQSQERSVIVTVGASTILAVGDTNGDGKISLADVSQGDHVVVFTQDATANAIAALGILDASHAGGDHHGGGDAPRTPPTPIPGTVTSVDPTGHTLSLTVSEGTLSGQTITVDVAPNTSFGGQDSGGDGEFRLDSINPGDGVVVYTRDATADPIVAIGVVDTTTKGASSTAPVSAPVLDAFEGTAGPVGVDSFQVTVAGDGPLGGQTVTVAVTATTRVKGVTSDGSPFVLVDIKPGDQVRLYTTSLDPQALVAVFVGDGAPGAATSTTTSPAPAPPPPPTRFGGAVTAVLGGALTVTVTSGGPLHGQSVIVAVPPTASLKGVTSLAGVSVGDSVEIYTTSAPGSPIVAVGVIDDSVAPAS